MHSHRNKNGAAPFVGNREATTQDKQRHERGKMCVGSSEQQRAKYNPQKAADVAFEHAIDEKSENKLLNNWCDRDCENNDQNSLPDCARCTKELDDALLA